MKRTPLKRYTRIKPKRSTPRRRKTVVRLTGVALHLFRNDVWRRAGGRSEWSGKVLHYSPRFDGDPDAFDLAHLTSKGAGGSDVMDNVMALSHKEHMDAHQGKIKLPATYAELVSGSK